MILKPEQIPTGVVKIEGVKHIVFTNNDNQIQLFCRAASNGNLVIKRAEEFDWNPETEQWDIENEITPRHGVERFGHDRALNPLTGKIKKLIYDRGNEGFKLTAHDIDPSLGA